MPHLDALDPGLGDAATRTIRILNMTLMMIRDVHPEDHLVDHLVDHQEVIRPTIHPREVEDHLTTRPEEETTTHLLDLEEEDLADHPLEEEDLDVDHQEVEEVVEEMMTPVMMETMMTETATLENAGVDAAVRNQMKTELVSTPPFTDLRATTIPSPTLTTMTTVVHSPATTPSTIQMNDTTSFP